jgi:hypothetical protein
MVAVAVGTDVNVGADVAEDTRTVEVKLGV